MCWQTEGMSGSVAIVSLADDGTPEQVRSPTETSLVLICPAVFAPALSMSLGAGCRLRDPPDRDGPKASCRPRPLRLDEPRALRKLRHHRPLALHLRTHLRSQVGSEFVSEAERKVGEGRKRAWTA